MTQQAINFEDMVRTLAKPGEAILESLTPEKAHLLHMAIGIAGEAGELLDAVKKHVIYNKPLDMVNVIEELGDIAFYEAGIRGPLNISREQIIEANIAKLGERYAGFKYTDKAAQERADKVAA